MGAWSDYSRFLISLFTILTPFAALPIFLNLSAGQGDAERRRTARAAALTVAAVLVGAALSGDVVLALLGTSLASFRVGGGLVLLLMALSMLSAKVSTVQHTAAEVDEAANRQSVGVVPLGLPLLAGPGAISSVIIESQKVPSTWHQLAIIACILITSWVLYWFLKLSTPIGNALGTFGLNIMSRLFGLFLTAIAVELMASGLRTLFSGLN